MISHEKHHLDYMNIELNSSLEKTVVAIKNKHKNNA